MIGTFTRYTVIGVGLYCAFLLYREVYRECNAALNGALATIDAIAHP